MPFYYPFLSFFSISLFLRSPSSTLSFLKDPFQDLPFQQKPKYHHTKLIQNALLWIKFQKPRSVKHQLSFWLRKLGLDKNEGSWPKSMEDTREVFRQVFGSQFLFFHKTSLSIKKIGLWFVFWLFVLWGLQIPNFFPNVTRSCFWKLFNSFIFASWCL